VDNKINFYDKDEDYINSEEISLNKAKSHKVKIKKIESLTTRILSQLSGKEISEFIYNLVMNKEFSEQMHDIRSMLSFNSMRSERSAIHPNLNAFDMETNNVQFVFLFSSPLVRENNGAINSIMQLDWLSEIENIIDSLEAIKYKLNYRTQVATKGKLKLNEN
jgi:hypothetical protein